MLPKSRLKFIKSLHLKKNRDQAGLFLVEGAKSVLELLKSDYKIRTILATETYLPILHTQAKGKVVEWFEVNEKELKQAGTLVSNNTALAIAEQKPVEELTPAAGGMKVVLDNLNNPGNLGTIIRTADWFGISQIIAGANTVDFYNPKVVSASKGSLFRMGCCTLDLENYLSRLSEPVLAAEAGGEPLHQSSLPHDLVLIMGSESHGISAKLRPHITQSVAIPGVGSAESLNVGIAAGILMNAWFLANN